MSNFRFCLAILAMSFSVFGAKTYAGGPMVPLVAPDVPSEVIEIVVPKADFARCVETLAQVFSAPVANASEVSTPVQGLPEQRVVCRVE